KDIFADYRVRQALTLALDFDWLNRNYLHDAYKRTDSFFVDPQMIAHSLPKGSELSILAPFKDQLPSFIFSKPVEEFIPTDTQKSRADLNKAKDLLKEAGWIIKNNELLHEKTNKKMEFEILLALPFYEKVVHSYAHNLAKLGIKANIRTVESTQYEKRVQDHDFGMIIHYWNQSYYPGCEQSFNWGSAQASMKGSKNYAGIADPVIDYLISTIPKAPNLEAYLASTRALDRLLRAHQFVIPLFQPRENHCAFWDKFGFPEAPPPHGFRNIRWWALHTWWAK
ncbi:MAG: ABC transporter substrate-binding protein, partial [Alphaproteobacteria bacterium]|nr:ABC transporter substrate-binding protein [Alphaproteobacteria bacterium]